jgi:hypothetical protein
VINHVCLLAGIVVIYLVLGLYILPEYDHISLMFERFHTFTFVNVLTANIIFI